MADAKKCVKAKLVAKDHEDPDLQEGIVETSGRVSLRSSNLQVISLRAIKIWNLRSLDIEERVFVGGWIHQGRLSSRTRGMGPAM